MALFLNNLPPTEEGVKLELTPELEEKCRVVYKLDDEGGALFAGLWDSENEYSDEYVIVPVRSTFKEKKQVKAGDNFANVCGSKKDKHPGGGTWIDFYKSNTGEAGDACCTDKNFYNTNNNMPLTHIKIPSNPNPVQPDCGGCMVGGHVILGANAAAFVVMGQDVAMLPICDNHNRGMGIDAKGEYVNKWGRGYYMKTESDITAMILKGYLEPLQLQAAIKGVKF